MQFAVAVGSSLKPQIAASGYALCGGDSLTLDAGAGYASYAWNTGATSEEIVVTAPGMYTVHVADATGCSGADGAGHRNSAARAGDIGRYGSVRKYCGALRRPFNYR